MKHWMDLVVISLTEAKVVSMGASVAATIFMEDFRALEATPGRTNALVLDNAKAKIERL